MIVKNNGTNPIGFLSGKLILSPGNNEVKNDDWGKVENHPLVKRKINENVLVVLQSEEAIKKPRKNKKRSAFEDFPQNESQEVEQTQE